MPHPEPDNRIRRLHVRDAPADTPETRLALRRILHEAVELPPTLPPHAILLVPRLAPNTALPLHAPHDAHRWAADVRTLLANLAAHAHIPTDGHIPADAPALFLRDRAEWLALVLLIAAGLEPPPTRFTTLANATRQPPAAWLQHEPHLAPAALAQLRRWRKQAALLATFSPTEAEAATRTIAAAWGIPLPAAPLAPHAAHSALAGLCTLLAETPHRAQHATWQTALRAWWQTMAATDKPTRSNAPPTDSPHSPTSRTDTPTPSFPDAATSAESTTTSNNTTPPTNQPATPADTTPPHANQSAATPPAHTQPHASRTEAICATQSAGVLFLLNVCRWLNLPASVTADLSGWAWVELLARALLDTDAIPHDPIWLWLAEMDGREPGTLPGNDLPDWETFTLPPTWLHELAPLHWRSDEETLALFTADGLWLAVAPRADEPAHLHAAQLARPYGDRPQPHPTLPPRFTANAPWWPHLHPSLRLWLGYAMPFVRRLWDERTDHTPPAAILHSEHTAHIYTSATHVDVVWPLDAVSLPARLAGLDASPGWMPTVGRVVTFEFR